MGSREQPGAFPWGEGRSSASGDDTAKLLGMSVGSVYVAKSRCMKILRETVARLNAEDPELKLDE